MNSDVISAKDLKLLALENISLSYLASIRHGGYILLVSSASGKRTLISQRGKMRIFKTLDAVLSFLRGLNAEKFEVQILGKELDEKI
ncbi:hypothetical protein AB7Y04_16540 [Providencia rettgeri]|uniref:hypothetical protein n=1 Tax=Providencia rettgeri TaxID=587 RepID=UPI0034E7DBA1